MKRYLSLFILIGLVGCSSELDRCIEANKSLLDKDDVDLDTSLMEWGEIDFNETSPKEIYANFDRGIGSEREYGCPVYEFEGYDDFNNCVKNIPELPELDINNLKKYEDLTSKEKLQLLIIDHYWNSIVKDWENSYVDHPLIDKHPKNWTISDLILLKQHVQDQIDILERSSFKIERYESVISEAKQTILFIDAWTKVSIQARLSEMPLEICHAQGIY